MKTHKFKIELTDGQYQNLVAAAKKNKISEETQLNQIAALVADRILSAKCADLSPKEVAQELGCHKDTVFGYIRQGKFPNTFRLNGRVTRIPRTDVVALRENLRLAAPV